MCLKLALTGFIAAGCSTVPPGEDVFLVRVQQTEEFAKASFDLVARCDNNSREFFRTNLPAFHSFVGWLREPQTVGTNSLPRGMAMVLSVDNLRLAYSAGKASSNDLYFAAQLLSATANEAAAWSNIATHAK